MAISLRRADHAAIACAIEGQISKAEAAALARLAAAVEPAAEIVEIGSYRGRSTVALALGSRSGAGARVYAVDPHVEFTGARGGRFGPTDRQELYGNLAAAGVGDLVAVVALGSVAAARAWDSKSVGLLFVDGDHAAEAVQADVDAWLPHLRPDAVVAFHDVDFAGVADPLAALVASGVLRAVGRVDSLAWFELGGAQ
jgi:predicted O-methyltransferase YrrM